jgi:hypothetical protein
MMQMLKISRERAESLAALEFVGSSGRAIDRVIRAFRRS